MSLITPTLIRPSLVLLVEDSSATVPVSPSFGGVTVLSMSFDGTSTSITDDTGTHTGSFNNGAKLSTDKFKFGNSSAYGDGVAGSLVRIPNNKDFDIINEDFTFSLWFNGITLGTQYLLTKFPGWRCWVGGSTVLYWWLTQGDGSALNITSTGQSIIENNWNHYMLTGDVAEGKIRQYFNGNFIKSIPYNGTIQNTLSDIRTHALTSSSNSAYEGHIDDVYINIGAAYTKSELNYTLPAKPLALL